MSWVETTDSRIPAADANGNIRCIRVFRVYGSYARTAILSDPASIVNGSGEPLPELGSYWEGMQLDRYEVSAVGTYFDATALYSNDKRFVQSGGLVRTDDGFKSWSGGTTDGDVDVPYARRKKITISVANPNGPPVIESFDTWVFGSLVRKQKVEIIRREVSISTKLNVGQAGGIVIYQTPQKVEQTLEAIYQQLDKLHKVRGRWYRYKGADWRQIDRYTWSFEHKWEHEGGVYAKFSVPPTDTPILLPNGLTWFGDNREYAVPPYHTVVAVPKPTQPGNPPNPSAWPDFKIALEPDISDPLGWSTLPGVIE